MAWDVLGRSGVPGHRIGTQVALMALETGLKLVSRRAEEAVSLRVIVIKLSFAAGTVVHGLYNKIPASFTSYTLCLILPKISVKPKLSCW